MKRLKRLLFICLYCFPLFGEISARLAQIPVETPQQQGMQQAAPVEKSNDLQNNAANVAGVDVLGAAHNAKMAISMFINALNNWEDAQTAAGLLPNAGNLQNDLSSYLQSRDPDGVKQEKEKKKDKKKKNKKEKKKKKDKKKKNKADEVIPQEKEGEKSSDTEDERVEDGSSSKENKKDKEGKKSKKKKKDKKKKKKKNKEIEEQEDAQSVNAQAAGDDWKNEVPDKASGANRTAAVEDSYRAFVLAENATDSRSKKSYRLDTENLEQFREELEEYRNEKGSAKA